VGPSEEALMTLLGNALIFLGLVVIFLAAFMKKPHDRTRHRRPAPKR
jgi:uncharacterized membrane protein